MPSMYSDEADDLFLSKITFTSPNRDEQLDRFEQYIYAQHLAEYLARGRSVKVAQDRARQAAKDDREYALELMELAHNGDLFP